MIRNKRNVRVSIVVAQGAVKWVTRRTGVSVNPDITKNTHTVHDKIDLQVYGFFFFVIFNLNRILTH